MTVLDANILVYAYDVKSPQHAQTAAWLNRILESGEPIGLPWISVWAFLRISTNARIWETPMDVGTAFGIINQWISEPGVVVVQPGPRHTKILGRLMQDHSVTGSLTTDAVIAALAIENGAVLASTDQDFRRFVGLRWVNPLRP